MELKYKISNEIKLSFFLFLLLSSCFLLSSFWHKLAPFNIPNISLSLKEFDYYAYDDSNSCFTYVVEPRYLEGIVGYPISFVSGNKTLGSANIEVYKETVEQQFCFPSSSLEYGDNLVELLAGSKRLFFHIEKLRMHKPEEKVSFKILDVNDSFITFSFESNSIISYKPVEIYVNGKLDHLSYPQESGIFFETISTSEGNNIVELKYGTTVLKTEVVRQPELKMPFAIGALLFCIMIFVLAIFVFGKSPFFEKAALSFSTSACISISITFILNLLKILSLLSFIIFYVIAIVAIILLFRKKLSQNFSKPNIGKTHPLVILCIFILIVTPVFFHLTSWDHLTYWNGFYERHSEDVAKTFSQPLFDSLSYFGRVLGFIPGYFFLEASFSWLMGISGTALFAIILLFSNLLFFFSVFYFGESLSFSMPKRALLFLLFWFESFIRVGITISPRHAISLSLLLVAIATLIKKKDFLLSGLVLGIGAFVQTPILAAFIPLYIIVARDINWKLLAKSTALAAIIFGFLYLPNFFNFGILSQAESSNWGYLIDYTFENMFTDLGPLILFFLVFHLIALLKKEIAFDSYSKKMAVAAVLGLIFQLVISYRWNVYNAVNIAVLLVYWFPEEAIDNKYVSRILGTTFLLAAAIITVWTGSYSLSTYQQGPLIFLQQNTASESRILSDPLFSHAIEHVSRRSVMADLAVEYADERMLLDSYNFLEDKNYLVLQKYDIDYVVNQSDMVNRNAFRNKKLKERLEFEEINKIYDNDFIFIHQVHRK